MAYKVKETYEKVEVERVIPGFGQRKFKLGSMTSEEVEKWVKRGADIAEYFDEVTAKEAEKAAGEKSAEDAARDRYRGRVERLLAAGYARVKDEFKHENGKVIAAKEVADAVDTAFDAFMEKEAEAKEEKVVEPSAPVEPAKVEDKAPAKAAGKTAAKK